MGSLPLANTRGGCKSRKERNEIESNRNETSELAECPSLVEETPGMVGPPTITGASGRTFTTTTTNPLAPMTGISPTPTPIHTPMDPGTSPTCGTMKPFPPPPVPVATEPLSKHTKIILGFSPYWPWVSDYHGGHLQAYFPLTFDNEHKAANNSIV